MDSLPDEVLDHIIGFLPFKSKFVISSVCKRWKESAEQSIPKQKRLMVSSYPPMAPTQGYVDVHSQNRRQMIRVWNSLMKLDKLIWLDIRLRYKVEGCAAISKHQLVNLIKSNAPTLQFVRLSVKGLEGKTFEWVKTVPLPQLKMLLNCNASDLSFLVQHSPLLEVLINVMVTDQAMAVLAGLQHLRRLETVTREPAEVTTGSILFLLRGKSRHTLTTIVIGHVVRGRMRYEYSMQTINRELDNIHGETGGRPNVSLVNVYTDRL